MYILFNITKFSLSFLWHDEKLAQFQVTSENQQHKLDFAKKIQLKFVHLTCNIALLSGFGALVLCPKMKPNINNVLIEKHSALHWTMNGINLPESRSLSTSLHSLVCNENVENEEGIWWMAVVKWRDYVGSSGPRK